MFERHTDERERGQVGIGTLIVFIALVLVAAIAAGVLINTAGFLQTQAQQTGEEASSQVSNRLEPAQVTGNVTGDEKVDKIDIMLQKAPGASNINLSAATLSFVGPDGTERFAVTNKSVFENESFQDSDGSLDAAGSGEYLILNDKEDRVVLTIVLNNTDLYSGPQGSENFLEPGEEVTIRLSGESGATTVIRLSVPQSLSGKRSVSL